MQVGNAFFELILQCVPRYTATSVVVHFVYFVYQLFVKLKLSELRTLHCKF